MKFSNVSDRTKGRVGKSISTILCNIFAGSLSIALILLALVAFSGALANPDDISGNGTISVSGNETINATGNESIITTVDESGNQTTEANATLMAQQRLRAKMQLPAERKAAAERFKSSSEEVVARQAREAAAVGAKAPAPAFQLDPGGIPHYFGPYPNYAKSTTEMR